MNSAESMRHELRSLFPVWLGCVLLPSPAIVFWRSHDGRAMALLLFCIGCASLVVYAFRRDLSREIPGRLDRPERVWHQRMATAWAALFAAFLVFALEFLTFGGTQDFVGVFLAFLALIPAVCVVPFFVLVTRRPVAAVVFALFTVFCMKLLGGIVVVLVHGWNADKHGYTDMPWTHPNLLVWLFWINTGVLSLLLYLLGARRFQASYARAA